MNSLFRAITSSTDNKVVSMQPQQQSVSFQMMEKIHIDDLKLKMNIGVTDEERNTKQTILISIDMDVDGNEAWESDSINDVVSYVDIVNIIEKIAQDEFKLVETLAKQIITACYAHSPKIQGIVIKIDKPDIFENIEAVGCMIESYRNA